MSKEAEKRPYDKNKCIVIQEIFTHRMIFVDISLEKGVFTVEETDIFGKDIMDQVVKTYKKLKGGESYVSIVFRELVGARIKES